jgi:putative Mg2+ transporter-C (MgtC) family protein
MGPCRQCLDFAAAFVTLGMRLNGQGGAVQIAAYVVSGIGFLGAGVIMKNGAQISGLNTAATLWCSAAVGALSGVGLRPVPEGQ